MAEEMNKQLELLGIPLASSSDEEKNAVLSLISERDSALTAEQNKVAELQAKLEAAKEELKNATSKLAAEASKPKKADGFGEFELNKVKYRLNYAGLVVPGRGKVSAAEILESKELQEKLVEIKSGALTKMK